MDERYGVTVLALLLLVIEGHCLPMYVIYLSLPYQIYPLNNVLLLLQMKSRVRVVVYLMQQG
jgi:hypothetical protein